MTKRPITNVAASARDRFLNRGRQTGWDFQFLLSVTPRAVSLPPGTVRPPSRSSSSMPCCSRCGGSVYWPTCDLDFAGYGNSDVDDVIATFREICAVPVPDDGLFLSMLATVRAEPIRGKPRSTSWAPGAFAGDAWRPAHRDADRHWLRQRRRSARDSMAGVSRSQ